MNNDLILKTSKYILILALTSFIFSEDKSDSESKNIEIIDLFYDSESTLISADIEKTSEFYEDFELESLEIKDIDIVTFGEYEAFLNKYYDDNFIDINSRFIRQIEFISGGIIGQKIPFGQNAQSALKNGINFGVRFNEILNFKYKKLNFSTNLEISYDSNTFRNSNSVTDVNIFNIEPSLSLNLIKNISLKSGLGLMSINIVESSNGKILDHAFGLSSFLELQYKIKVYNNIHLTIFSKAKLEKSTGDIRLYNASATVESLVFGIGTIIPIHLMY